MRRTLVSGSALFLLLALGCPPAADAQTRDATLVYALQSDVDTWDPPNSVLREAIILGYHVFDHLAVRDLKTRRVVPNLALSWKALNDTTWEVKLRQGVKFHDGSPFTARDVKATFERVLDPTKKMTARGNHAKIKSVEIVDDHTVKFHTDGPYPIFVERLTALVMASEKVIKDKGHEWMQEHPTGTVPYKLVKWDSKHEHLLVRNDEYWGPKAPYKYVRIRIIPEQATQIAELISGGVDVIKAVPPDQIDVINKSGQARTASSPILRTAFLQLDQAARSKDSKAGPMFSFSWGYYSVFDADAILYDIFKCKETYAYYCNPAMDDLIIQGRSTLDQKKRAEVYAKAQKLAFDDAAYLFKWGLRGVWGISNRVDYQAPPDEVDRMFLVTPRKK